MIQCTPLKLPDHKILDAAKTAIEANPGNTPNIEAIVTTLTAFVPGLKISDIISPMSIAIMTTKYWGKQGVNLGVKFLDNPNQATKNRILKYANLCGRDANIKFWESNSNSDIRLTREQEGCWSYLGPDIRHVDGPTMCLERVTENYPSDEECMRIIPHEFLHSAGCPHEHMRKKIIDRLDVNKTCAVYERDYNWPPEMTKSQVFVPLEEQSLLGTINPEEDSIMTYTFSGECTKDGQPIIGGSKITETDHALLAKYYPKAPINTITIDIDNKGIKIPTGWKLNITRLLNTLTLAPNSKIITAPSGWSIK